MVCPNGNDIYSDCTKEELQFEPLSTNQIPENPPPIVKATLFYYLNGDNTEQQTVDMEYNMEIDKWEGKIPGQA